MRVECADEQTGGQQNDRETEVEREVQGAESLRVSEERSVGGAQTGPPAREGESASVVECRVESGALRRLDRSAPAAAASQESKTINR